MRSAWLRRSVLMLGCLAFASSVCAQTRIKFATIAPKGTSPVKAMEKLTAGLKERSNGQLQLKVYPGAVAGDELEVLRKIKMGQIHAAGFTGVGFGEILPEVRVLDVPFLFSSYEEVDFVHEALFAHFAERFQEQGFVLLAWAEVGFVHLYSKRRIGKPADMRSLKPWSWAGDPIAEATLKHLGATPIALPVTDVLTGLQTGMVDTVYAHPVGCVGLQWFTKVSTMSQIPLTHSTGAVLIKKSVFDSLKPQLQGILLDETQKEMARLTEITRKENEEAVVQIEGAGVKSVPFSDKEAFLEAGRKTRDALTDSVYPKELLDRVMGLLQEFRDKEKQP